MAKVETNTIEDIVSALKKIEYGSLVITVHDGEITQIDATEKKRYKAKGKQRKAQ
ncbi:YezD family protein [Siminovitchia sp. 179-K 8D1 HS]|uniref:YezD family protein n=1 Tax=Siminovitchia sp. 179-K 8D1 HS TaxID=3142385 RepID=UPI0039A30830